MLCKSTANARGTFPSLTEFNCALPLNQALWSSVSHTDTPASGPLPTSLGFRHQRWRHTGFLRGNAASGTQRTAPEQSGGNLQCRQYLTDQYSYLNFVRHGATHSRVFMRNAHKKLISLKFLFSFFSFWWWGGWNPGSYTSQACGVHLSFIFTHLSFWVFLSR